jgi:hypothetical protein
MKTSIQCLEFSGELNSSIDRYLNPALFQAPFLPMEFTDYIKTTIASSATAKVNELKRTIDAQMDALNELCARRRLGAVELNEDGSQKILQNDLTFGALSTSVHVTDVIGMVSQSNIF